MSFMEPMRSFYSRYERQISSLFLIGGFILDALTLKRPDRWFENTWIIGYIVLIAIFIILLHRQEISEDHGSAKARFWYLNILQFCFGGVLSANLVLYFRSSDVFVAWPFILILAIAFWANESLREQHTRFSFQISLFFFGIYSFMIFFLPVMVHRLGPVVFVVSGLLSLMLIGLFTLVVFYFTREKFKDSKRLILILILSIFAAINIFYFTNLIPPMPLALKEGEAYHSILKIENGKYEVKRENLGWQNYFDLYPNLHKIPDAPVYIWSSVFSPAGLDLTIVHRWQHYDDGESGWTDYQVVDLPVRGGRDGGFRTYSLRHNLAPGKWRVRVETKSGQEIGQIRFEVMNTDATPILLTEQK